MAKTWQEWWEESLTKNLFVDPVVAAAKLPGQVFRGEVPLFDETGHTSPELIERTTDYASTIPLAGLAAGGSAAARMGGQLFSGPALGAKEVKTGYKGITDPLEAEMQWLLDELTGEKLLSKWEVDDSPAFLPAQEEAMMKEFGIISDDLPELKYTGADAVKPKKDPLALPALGTLPDWMKKPATPSGFTSTSTFGPQSPEFGPIMEQLYLKDMDPSLVTKAIQGDEDVMKQLYGLLPPNWLDEKNNPTKNLIAPHAVNLAQKSYHDAPSAFQGDDEAMKRARSMGFDPDKMFYKGTNYPEHGFMDPSTKPRERALFFGDRADVGGAYGNWLYPVHLRMENPYISDWGQTSYEGPRMIREIEEARRLGHDSAVMKNMYDMGGLQDQYLIFNPNQARSTYAKFDPARRDENNLLAAQTVGISPFEGLKREEQRPEQQVALNFPEDAPKSNNIREIHPIDHLQSLIDAQLKQQQAQEWDALNNLPDLMADPVNTVPPDFFPVTPTPQMNRLRFDESPSYQEWVKEVGEYYPFYKELYPPSRGFRR